MPEGMRSLGHEAKELLKDGVLGGAAIVVYDKFVSSYARQFLGKVAGGWTDAVGAFVVALAADAATKKSSGRTREYTKSAVTSLFAAKLGEAFETQLPGITGGIGATRMAPSHSATPTYNWGGTASVPLSGIPGRG